MGAAVQSAHVMAMAVQKLFPKAQVTIGPWIAKGFYYDFDLSEPLTDKDLKKIKKEMVGATRHVTMCLLCGVTVQVLSVSTERLCLRRPMVRYGAQRASHRQGPQQD